ncbi:uncharacterized protein LOC128227578 isoform X1 [Mya arenaria]|uniref:uncharacterized protein LOC128227578 isoform X1 n=1 Tax=Mya arenaria TaxID=6604 RepID=UPI0022E23C39|nr:uncharacterized protein LOC128227578 isoform X1 [Mya arenaria]
MGTSLSAQRNGSTFYTSEQTQEELLSELEEKFIEWQEKIKAFKGKIKSSESIRKYLLGEIKTASEYLRTKVPDECSAHEDSIANKLPETKRLENEITFLKAENEHLRLRLSKIAGDQLTRDNPNITDLTDPNRPLKLGEKYSELYDNEWTDAYESLTHSGYSEAEAVETLQLTLKNTFQFCEGKAELILKKTGEAVNLLFEEYRNSVTFERSSTSSEVMLLQSRWQPKRISFVDSQTSTDDTLKKVDPVHVDKQMKQLRKEVADSIVPVVQKHLILENTFPSVGRGGRTVVYYEGQEDAEDFEIVGRSKLNVPDECRQHEESNAIMLQEAKRLKDELKSLKAENERLRLRLSKFAGDQLTRDNPNITDLSDPNRPQKLGEKYSELYDNEWTEAYESLTHSGYSEADAVETLQLTLKNTFQFCERKAQLILQKTEDAVNLLFEEYRNSAILEAVPSHVTVTGGKKCLVLTSGEDMQLQKRWEPKRRNFLDSKTFTDDTPQKADHVHVDKQMKHLRKEVAGSILPIVQKAYMDASWQKECLSSLKPFINKCLFIGWMMVVQTPPMDFKSARKGDHFDKNIFNYYTKSGKFIDVVVWPALLLHKDGPVVGKGIAQPRIKTT